jgi:hypothetical protein
VSSWLTASLYIWMVFGLLFAARRGRSKEGMSVARSPTLTAVILSPSSSSSLLAGASAPPSGANAEVGLSALQLQCSPTLFGGAGKVAGQDHNSYRGVAQR